MAASMGTHSHAHPMTPTGLHHNSMLHGDPGIHMGALGAPGSLGASLAPLSSSPGCGPVQCTPQPVIKSDYGLTAL